MAVQPAHPDATPYEVVRFEPSLRDQVLDLQRHLWDPDPAVNAAYLEWKYGRNPFSRDYPIYLVVRADRVVAMRGFWAMRWQCGSPPASVAMLGVGDTVVAPDHRGQGLVRRIMATAETALRAEGHDYLINLSASPVSFRTFIRTGWQSIDALGPMRRRTLVDGTRGALVQRLRRMPIGWRLVRSTRRRKRGGRTPAFERFDRVMDGGGVGNSGIRLARVPDAAGMASLVDRIGWNGRLRHVRTAAVLRWRYQNPLAEYRFLYHGGPEVDGFLVLHARRRGTARALSIVDWEAITEGVARQLVRAAISLARPGALGVWTASRSATLRDLLRSEGFAATDASRGIADYRPSVLLKRLGRAAGDADPTIAGRRVLDPASWDLRMLYSDNY